MPTPKNTARRRNLQHIGNQLADLLENPDTPYLVDEGIQNFLCELNSVVSFANPRLLRAFYPLIVEEAEKEGIALDESNYVGQNIAHEERQAVN